MLHDCEDTSGASPENVFRVSDFEGSKPPRDRA